MMLSKLLSKMLMCLDPLLTIMTMLDSFQCTLTTILGSRMLSCSLLPLEEFHSSIMEMSKDSLEEMIQQIESLFGMLWTPSLKSIKWSPRLTKQDRLHKRGTMIMLKDMLQITSSHTPSVRC